MRGKRPKNKATKTALTFDEDARRDFLLGFHKRKVERKIKYQKKLQDEMKAEIIRAKKEAREKYATARKNQRIVPEIAHLIEPIIEEKEDAVVTITDLSDGTDLAGDNFIGTNKASLDETEPKEEDDEETKKLKEGLVSKGKKELQRDVNRRMTRILQRSKTIQKAKNQQTKKNIKANKLKEKGRVKK